MSWSVNAKGHGVDVIAELDRQFLQPLAEPPGGLGDEGERETVRRIHETITQCLETFGPQRTVSVTANGHMGYANYDTKEGAYQTVNVSIQPGN